MNETDRSMLTPREIVSELDKYIVGQNDAKRAVAVALRNRWRRSRVPEPLHSEITPKNILMTRTRLALVRPKSPVAWPSSLTRRL